LTCVKRRSVSPAQASVVRALLLGKVYRLLEPGPVVLVAGRALRLPSRMR